MQKIPDLENPAKIQDLKKALNNMMEILALDEDKFNRYINIYDSEKKESDIESIVMEALSKREKNEIFSSIATVNDALKNETSIILVQVKKIIYSVR